MLVKLNVFSPSKAACIAARSCSSFLSSCSAAFCHLASVISSSTNCAKMYAGGDQMPSLYLSPGASSGKISSRNRSFLLRKWFLTAPLNYVRQSLRAEHLNFDCGRVGPTIRDRERRIRSSYPKPILMAQVSMSWIQFQCLICELNH